MSKTRLLRNSKIPALKHSTKASPISKGGKSCSLLFLQMNFVIREWKYSPWSPPFLWATLEYWKGPICLSLEPSVLQVEQPWLSQPFLRGEQLQPSKQLSDLLWVHCNRSPSFLCWGPSSGHSTPGGLGSPEQRRRIPPSTCWPVCFSGSPATFLPPFMLLFWFLSHLLSKHLRNLG